MSQHDSMISQVGQAIIAFLENDHKPAVGTIAKVLHMTARTLQRRLQEEGTTYREVIDAVRLERAEHLLRRGDSVTNVACIVGFSTLSGFSRSYKEWTGQLPSSVKPLPPPAVYFPPRPFRPRRHRRRRAIA